MTTIVMLPLPRMISLIVDLWDLQPIPEFLGGDGVGVMTRVGAPSKKAATLSTALEQLRRSSLERNPIRLHRILPH